MYTHFPNLLAELPAIPAGSIVSRTVYSDDRMKAILFAFAAGQELSEHTAARPAILHILEGEADVTLGGDAFSAGPGFWAHMPPQLPHSIYAKTQVAMLLLMV